jgi:anti-anti-sigma factor
VAETIVQPPARLEAGAVREFERQLAAASLLGNERVLVDLSLTSFISSVALRSLLTTARRLAAQGGRLVVVVTSVENARLFMASGLDQVIPVHATLAHARAALARR